MRDERPTHVDLFSGIAGFALAAEWAGFRTIAFSEINRRSIAVLGKHWPAVPNLGDVRTAYATTCDLLTGGDPCQPHSQAGNRRGKSDHRYLWPEMLRFIEESRPTWIINENVVGSIGNLVLDQKISDLEAIDYACQAFVIPACAIGANHQRNRVWLVAYTERGQWWNQSHNGALGRVGREQQPFPWDRDWESALREFRGMDDGLSYGVDRVDGIRNAIVPQVAYQIIKAIHNQITNTHD